MTRTRKNNCKVVTKVFVAAYKAGQVASQVLMDVAWEVSESIAADGCVPNPTALAIADTVPLPSALLLLPLSPSSMGTVVLSSTQVWMSVIPTGGEHKERDEECEIVRYDVVSQSIDMHVSGQEAKQQ